jgi:SPP1 family phage portal protein
MGVPKYRLNYYGREPIYTDETAVTAENLLDVLQKAFKVHTLNRSDIDYLYNYYKGKQPILERTKEFRKDICNVVVENHANEIVSFKTGYLMSNAIQYVSRDGDVRNVDAVDALNKYMQAASKASCDRVLAEWFAICGVAYRIVLKRDDAEGGDVNPIMAYNLDPRNTFVVYSSGIGHEPMLGVSYVQHGDGSVILSCYTKTEYFKVGYPATVGLNGMGAIQEHTEHILGDIPIIEYLQNPARLGAFETVLTQLDALNIISSNRLDGVEQFIQSILVTKGIDLIDDSGEKIDLYAQLREMLGLNLPADGDAKYLTQELNQTQTQTLVDYLYQSVLVACGMPNRNGGSSTSDTGTAVTMRDGWADAEARAKDTEQMFEPSERRFLGIVLRILDATRHITLANDDIAIVFTRRNYENMQNKAQVFATLRAIESFPPLLAYEISGITPDPTRGWLMEQEYAASQERKKLETYKAMNTIDLHGGNE